MSSPIGMAEYFAMEAGEYLDRLSALLVRDTPPAAEELVRYSRALRGSALMANQPLIARSAAGLEAVAKAFREGRRPWDAALQERVQAAVTETRNLVRTAGSWDDDATERAERLAADLEALGGVASPGRPRQTPVPSGVPGTDSGVRAFVAREGALAASALDRAARALRTAPDGHEPLYAVLRRLQSLRGLAALTDLAPMPDMLESVERAVGELTRMFAPPPQVADVFEAAAQALARAAKDVAAIGRPSPEAEEPERFAGLLLRAFATEADVVPIESLFADKASGIVTPGRAPRESDLGTVELVSLGERLAEVADQLDRATTPAQRDLRLYAMVAALRPLETATGLQLPSNTNALAGAARELIAAGGVGGIVKEFAACIREAGGVFRGLAQPGNLRQAGEDLDQLSQRLHRLGAPVFRPVPVSHVATESPPPVRISEPVVPIEELLEQPSAPPAKAELPEPAGLEGSLLRLARLLRERGRGEASLEGFLAGTDAVAEPLEVVDIVQLCYHGKAALERATDLRQEVDALLTGGGDLGRVRPLLDELLDLVSLAAET
ncbi:MAG: Hpt domain-containing protein [Gemmatimonadota bacterium]